MFIHFLSEQTLDKNPASASSASNATAMLRSPGPHLVRPVSPHKPRVPDGAHGAAQLVVRRRVQRALVAADADLRDVQARQVARGCRQEGRTGRGVCYGRGRLSPGRAMCQRRAGRRTHGHASDAPAGSPGAREPTPGAGRLPLAAAALSPCQPRTTGRVAVGRDTGKQRSWFVASRPTSDHPAAAERLGGGGS